ncbi:MAG: cation:proton antiporter [Spirochaetaceae bacterium]|nr:MAG: cation:proton antiporter [Spirochaetaceae bacterium]
MALQHLIGQSLIGIGLLITAFGVYAVLRLDGFYTRIVVTSKVEAMGFVTIVIGAIVITGFDSATLKLVIILLFELVTVSVSAHAVARSAWSSGYQARTVIPGSTTVSAAGDD